MKNLNVFNMLLLTFVMSALTACSEDEDLNIPIPQHMTAEYVIQTLDGKGWEHIESHEIKSNGTYKKEDYWNGMLYVIPPKHSFSGDTVTTYTSIDAYSVNGYRKKSYAYNEATNQIMAGGNELFRIISLDENELRLIKYQAIDGNGKKIYVYSVYRAMSSYELSECIYNHPYNIDLLNEQYPMLPEQMRITSEYFSRHAVGNGWKCIEAHKMEMDGRYNIANIFRDNDPSMPGNCFIATDTITWLPQGQETPTSPAESMKYSYRPNSFYIATDTDNGFKIITLNDNEMRIVKKLQGNNGGDMLELYCIYRKMTSEELEQHQAGT